MKRIVKLYNRLMKRRFVLLLIALAVRLIFVPLAQALFPSAGNGFLAPLTGILFFLILLSALFAVSRTRLTVIISTSLLLAGRAADAVHAVCPAGIAGSIGEASDALFLLWCTALIVSRIFKVESVTFDTIAASLCAYLLLGMTWGLLYTLIERIHPGSFICVADPGADLIRNGTLTIYFSLVVLSTLGLGDIIPVTDSLRLLVGSEAVMGQIYLAVLVARLVGLHITHHKPADQT